MILFDPVSHFGHYLKVAPERASGIQELALRFEGRAARRPQPRRCSRAGALDHRPTDTATRALAGGLDREPGLPDALVGKRRPDLTAKRIFTNQTFRDLYRTDTLAVDQGLKSSA